MIIEASPLDGAALIKLSHISDHRGRFVRLFCRKELSSLGFGEIVQSNHTLTKAKGSVRGMHYQRPPHAEGKLLGCLRGRVFDVFVDLRAGSRTFLQWHGIELSADNAEMVYIPRGFAHGFQVLEPESELLYFHDAFYSPADEAGLNPLDPRLGIAWPLPVYELSKRDQEHPFIDDTFTGIEM